MLQQNRATEAEEQLRLALSANPDDAEAHALLALALLDLQRFAEATNEAQRAVASEPDEPSHHYTLGLTLLRRNHTAEARDAAMRAIELDPYDADFWGLRSACAIEMQDWRDALTYADEGLAQDPEHVQCRNLRAAALRNLGRHDEAAATLAGALRQRPDSAYTHANTGWSLLHRGGRKNVDQALEHFREALRLDPSSEVARGGMVEALKARYLVYRLMLRWFLWMASLKPGVRWGIILGAFFGARIVRAIASQQPALGPVLWPIYGLYLGFVWMTWLSYPLFNLALLFNRFGRHALTTEQRRGALLVAVCLLPALVLGVGWLLTQATPLGVAALLFLLLTIPVAGVYLVPEGQPRWIMGAVAAILASLGLLLAALFVWEWLAPGSTEAGANEALWEVAGPLSIFFFIGVFLSQFLVNWLAQRQPRL